MFRGALVAFVGRSKKPHSNKAHGWRRYFLLFVLVGEYDISNNVSNDGNKKMVPWSALVHMKRRYAMPASDLAARTGIPCFLPSQRASNKKKCEKERNDHGSSRGRLSPCLGSRARLSKGRVSYSSRLDDRVIRWLWVPPMKLDKSLTNTTS